MICDCIITVKEAQQLTDPSRVAFLVREPMDLIEEYCNRPDHKGFKDFIESAGDVEKAKSVCNETLCSINKDAYSDIKNSSYFCLERSEKRSAEETAQLVAQHFAW